MVLIVTGDLGGKKNTSLLNQETNDFDLTIILFPSVHLEKNFHSNTQNDKHTIATSWAVEAAIQPNLGLQFGGRMGF